MTDREQLSNDDEEQRPPVVLNPPKRIWLQVGELDKDADFAELGADNEQVSWCSDRIYDCDVEYVLASDAAANAARIRDLEADLRLVYDVLSQRCEELAAAQADAARRRADEHRAIEFAEYLAKAVEGYQEAANAIHEYYIEGEEPPEDKQESYSEGYRDVRNCIYEFRKRADRAQAKPETKS